MAYDASNASDVRLSRSGNDLLVSWTSLAAAGTTFQVYVDKVLAWSGKATTARLPYPRDRIRIDVGSVAAGEGATDFSSSLSGGEPDQHATLSWYGGTFQDADLAGFEIYGETTAGGGIDYATRLGYVPATVAGVDLSGFGLGGFGYGGFGQSGVPYTWRSARLSGGTWAFAVVPVDRYGNAQGSPSTASVAITAVPNPPAAYSDGSRLTYTYNSGTRVPTLTWQASP